ncbi:MAG: hypothetical protein KME16_04310 [Scytolyngbya sp. HA4215-MV1]|nr:hypothetical protein [Scytolyngbya sp. HA4215-MV1]
MDMELEGKQSQADLQSSNLGSIEDAIRAEASEYQGDSLKLLALLRSLEGVHREIRDGLFQQSLPDNRQALYALVRDIEAKGGWPYIQRMKLKALLEGWESEDDLNSEETLYPLSPLSELDKESQSEN